MYSLINARIYTVTNKIIENGFITIKNDKIHEIGPMSKFDFNSKKQIDLNSFTVYPGFIDAHTHLGLIPEGSSFNYDEKNKFTDIFSPDFKVLDNIDYSDIAFKDALSAGITTVAISPDSTKAISGQISAVKTIDCKNNILNKIVAVKMALGENPINFYKKNNFNYNKEDIKNLIIDELSKAKKLLNKNINSSKYAILFKLLKREIPVHFHVHDKTDINYAIEIANKFNLNCILIHATEAHKTLNSLKKYKAKIIQGPFFTNRSKKELLNMDMKSSSLLEKNGILYSITTDHPELPIQFLNLSASFAIKHGLSFKKAIEAITINAAKLCGVSNHVGSIEINKDADLVVFKNSPFKAFEEPLMVILNGNIVFNKIYN